MFVCVHLVCSLCIDFIQIALQAGPSLQCQLPLGGEGRSKGKDEMFDTPTIYSNPYACMCVCVVARRQGLGAHMASKDRVGGGMEESSHLPHLDAPWRHACLPSAGCPFESATDGGGPTRACGLGTLTRREGDSKAGRQAGSLRAAGRAGGRAGGQAGGRAGFFNVTNTMSCQRNGAPTVPEFT